MSSNWMPLVSVTVRPPAFSVISAVRLSTLRSRLSFVPDLNTSVPAVSRLLFRAVSPASNISCPATAASRRSVPLPRFSAAFGSVRFPEVATSPRLSPPAAPASEVTMRFVEFVIRAELVPFRVTFATVSAPVLVTAASPPAVRVKLLTVVSTASTAAARTPLASSRSPMFVDALIVREFAVTFVVSVFASVIAAPRASSVTLPVVETAPSCRSFVT